MTNLLYEYSNRFNTILIKLAAELELDLKEIFQDNNRIDRISSRPKSIDRFINKANKENPNGSKKYTDPLNQIQDQIGARIICFYLNDVELLSNKILDFYTPIEHKKLIPDSESEFGYEGQHFILHVPSEFKLENSPSFFELQIKTLFQHAWSEANHDLSYKPSYRLNKIQKRKIAFTAAQSWGADTIFNELFEDLN